MINAARQRPRPARHAPARSARRGVRASGTLSTTRYVYDESGQLLVESAPKKGEPATEIIWLDALPVGLSDRDGALRYIEADHLGTPRSVLDPSRETAVWRWPILGNAFGTQAAHEDPDGDGTATHLNLRFPGQQYDAATGLHYTFFAMAANTWPAIQAGGRSNRSRTSVAWNTRPHWRSSTRLTMPSASKLFRAALAAG